MSTDLLRESARLARSLEVRLHTHVAETRDEEQYTLERFGLRPLAYLEGWAGPAPTCGMPMASTSTMTS